MSACCGHKKNHGPLITTWGLGAASHKLQYLPVYSCSFNWLQIALNKFLGCRRSCAGLFSLEWTPSRRRGREKRKRTGDAGTSFFCSLPFILPSSSPTHNFPFMQEQANPGARIFCWYLRFHWSKLPILINMWLNEFLMEGDLNLCSPPTKKEKLE